MESSWKKEHALITTRGVYKTVASYPLTVSEENLREAVKENFGAKFRDYSERSIQSIMDDLGDDIEAGFKKVIDEILRQALVENRSWIVDYLEAL